MAFGAPYLPLHPFRYAKLLGDKIKQHKVHVYLVNTGWVGGPAGVGTRIPLTTTLSIIDAIHQKAVDHDAYTHHPVLNLQIPDQLANYDRKSMIKQCALHPWEMWSSRSQYEAAADQLARKFVDNFRQLCTTDVAVPDFDLAAHGPQLRS